MRKCNESLLSSFGFLVLVAFFRFALLREGVPAVVPIIVNFGTIAASAFGLYHAVVGAVWLRREYVFRKGFGFTAPSPGDWAKREASRVGVMVTLQAAAFAMDEAFKAEKSLTSQMEESKSFNETEFEGVRARVVKCKKQFWQLHDLATKFGYDNLSNEYRDFLK